MYLLTDHEGVPFEQDGFRDGERLRPWMTDRFVERLEESGRTWRRLTGQVDDRVAKALAAIDERGVGWWRHTDPLLPPV